MIMKTENTAVKDLKELMRNQNPTNHPSPG